MKKNSNSKPALVCIAYWLDFAISYVNGPAQWRFPIAFQAFFAVCLVLQVLPLPETPRFLVEKGRMEAVSTVIARLKGRNVPLDDPDVVALHTQISTSIELESAGGPFRYKELLKCGKIQNFRRIVLCALVNVQQQFTGYVINHVNGCLSLQVLTGFTRSNMINYYAPVVYANTMHLSRTMSLILGGCTSLTYLVGSCIPLWTMDRFGRRALLMFSASGLCICFSIAAGLLSTGRKSDAYGATAMVFLFQIFLGIGYLPIPWFYPSEITTTRIRSKGQAIASFINWMCVFTVVQITPIAIANISWRTFIIFAVCCALWVPIVYTFFPETNGLELEDVDHLFEKGGLTGGVWTSKGGRTVRRREHMDQLEEGGLDGSMRGSKDIREDTMVKVE